MDTTGFHAHHRAEHASRSAAAAAHASYYAHPALHLHTYLPRQHRHSDEDLPNGEESESKIKRPTQEGYYDPTAPSAAPAANGQEGGEEDATKGTKEELGGKEDAGLPSGLDKGALEMGGAAGGTKTSPGPSAQDIEEYKRTQGTGVAAGDRPGIEKFWKAGAIMEPHLQLLCGPLLAYYTVKDDIYQGAAMIVTSDPGSIYSPSPSLSLKFHPFSPPNEIQPSLHEPEVQLLQPITIASEKIFHYVPADGSPSATFFRFLFEFPLQDQEMNVRYRLNGGAEMDFVVPAKGQNLRWAAHSCNGFSSGVNPDEFKGKYESGYDPVWEDLLLHHHQKPFHCMVGGGDQIYCDPIIREPELQSWINAPNREKKLGHPLTNDMKNAIDRFYFNHYCKIFRSNAFGRANSSIPMVNMLDDHDLIDGFGTYDDETQAAPVMSYLGGRGYFWFLLFQLFVVDAVDGTNPTPGTHTLKSLIIGNPGAWIPYPSHSLLVYLGPKVQLLAIDCRAERKLDRICSPETYTKLFTEVKKFKGIEQLVMLLGVPIAYPRMSFLEHFLDFKYNPINMLARHGVFGLGSMVNKFNQASELLDDLNDHWCANTHKKERNWLVLECQKLALDMQVRITFLSGDVHLAAVGCLFTRKRGGNGRKIQPEKDHRYMLNVITSAIVNTPPPGGAAMMVAVLGGNKHRTLHHDHTDEMMIPLFTRDTDGSSLKRHFVQPRRNYAIVEYHNTGELEFDIRVEATQGGGTTVGYAVKAPAPRWDGVVVANGIKH